MTGESLKNGLAGFYGTESYHWLSERLTLTDGAKYLAEGAECYWLFDIVKSVIFTRFTKDEDFLNVKIEVEQGRGKVSIDNGNGVVLYTQKLDYTDFPIDSYEFFVCKTTMRNFPVYVAMLKSEY